MKSIWLPEPRHVAIFRALNLGDMLCVVPALRVLRAALPRATITLIGLPGASAFAKRYRAYIDEFVPFPGIPEFPEQAAKPDELPCFYESMRERAFDVVLQMHGAGPQSNAVAKRLATDRWAGFVPDAAHEVAGRFMAWPQRTPEIHRYLALLAFLGLDGGDDTLEFPSCEADQREADAMAQALGMDLSRTIFIHAGARLESRRWCADRYVAVARSIADWGWQVVLTGSVVEHPLVDHISAQLGTRAINLCGRTSLGGLASLLRRGKLLVCNDTGVSHLAAAVRLPSVVIACGSDVRRWAPLDSQRHIVLHQPIACRPCSYERCPIGHPCARAITVNHVLVRVRSQLEPGL